MACAFSGLLGHGPRGVKQRYVHLDDALVIAAIRSRPNLDGGETPVDEGGKALARGRSCQVAY
jgi:hypothetical protein